MSNSCACNHAAAFFASSSSDKEICAFLRATTHKLPPHQQHVSQSFKREAKKDESGFTCCAFSARERFLMLGTCTGQLKLYNVFSGQEEASYNCHNSAITHLEPSRVSNWRPVPSSEVFVD